MRPRFLRVIVLSAALLLSASELFAPVQSNCNNQPDLYCGQTCTQNGCVILVTPDGGHDYDFCYKIGGGTNCMGGTFHKCC
jgi:hypothetical protein